jgi:tetratricopeptide (TPR) repeat protein
MNIAIEVKLSELPEKPMQFVDTLWKVIIDEKEVSGVKLQRFNLPYIVEYELTIPFTTADIIYAVCGAYVGIINGIPNIREPKIIMFKYPKKLDWIREKLKKRLEEAHKNLSTTSNDATNSRISKLICIDLTDVVGRVVIPLLEMQPQYDEGLVKELEMDMKMWLEDHPNIDGVILTRSKLYLDPLWNPYALVFEPKVITLSEISLPTPRGWTIIIPTTLSDPAIATNMGAFLAERGFYSAAIRYYDHALRLNPRLKEAWNNKGRALNELGKFREALECLEKALNIDPGYISALINKGISLAGLNMFKEALSCFNKALELDPKNTKAMYNSAFLLYKLGEKAKARELLINALKLNPNYEKARTLLRVLEGSF